MLYERYARRRFEEGFKEGFNEGLIKALRERVREVRLEGLHQGFCDGLLTGRAERDREWDSWLQRRDEALAAVREFDEPPPSAKASTNGQ